MKSFTTKQKKTDIPITVKVSTIGKGLSPGIPMVIRNVTTIMSTRVMEKSDVLGKESQKCPLSLTTKTVSMPK